MEYQIERLHIIGDENPRTGLKDKVKGFAFQQTIDIPDPITKEMQKKPLKTFMVNQLTNCFDRHNMILSPYDEQFFKQLIDYSIVSISRNGNPVYTSKNEHFIDALGLAYLAFVLEFPTLTGAIKAIENKAAMMQAKYDLSSIHDANTAINMLEMDSSFIKNPWDNDPNYNDPREPKGEKAKWFKVPMGNRTSKTGWGSRRIDKSSGYRKTW